VVLQVVSAANAPPGCSFCRPQFAAAGAAAGTATVAHHRGSASSPVLHLEGLWHPLLGVQAGSSSSSSVVPNDVVLGGNSPGSMLLTGEGLLLVQATIAGCLFTLAPTATV